VVDVHAADAKRKVSLKKDNVHMKYCLYYYGVLPVLLRINNTCYVNELVKLSIFCLLFLQVFTLLRPNITTTLNFINNADFLLKRKA